MMDNVSKGGRRSKVGAAALVVAGAVVTAAHLAMAVWSTILALRGWWPAGIGVLAVVVVHGVRLGRRTRPSAGRS